MNVIMFDTNEPAERFRGRADIRNGIVRRRHWSGEHKARIVAEAVSPGAIIAEVARRHDMTPQHLSNWIRAAKRGRIGLPSPEQRECAEAAGVDFVPIVAMEAGKTMRASCIEIAAGVLMVRVPLTADARTLEVILQTLRRA